MTQTVQGSLTILNSHTPAPSYFWNGVQIEGVIRYHGVNDADERRVRFVVNGNQNAIYAAMIAAGINVKVTS